MVIGLVTLVTDFSVGSIIVEPLVLVEPAGLEVDVEVDALGSSDPDVDGDEVAGLEVESGVVVVVDVRGMAVDKAGCVT